MALESLTSRCSNLQHLNLNWTGGGGQITEEAVCRLVGGADTEEAVSQLVGPRGRSLKNQFVVKKHFLVMVRCDVP